MILSLVALALVGVAFGVVLPRIASYSSIWHVLRHIHWQWAIALLLAAALNVVTFALPWMVALAGLDFGSAVWLTQASTAVTLVVPGGAPVGMGVSYAMLRSRAFSSALVGHAVALTGVWSQLSTFLFPVCAAIALAVAGGGGHTVTLVAAGAGVLFAAGTGLVVAAVASRSVSRWVCAAASAGASLIGRLRRRPPARWSLDDFDRFRTEMLTSLRERWPALTVATIANQLTAYVVLDLSLRALGISFSQVSLVESFAAWSLARLIASLPLTPGGLGLVELGISGMLIGFGGPSAKVVAAVLLYRVLSIVPTLLLGLVAALVWQRGHAGARA